MPGFPGFEGAATPRKRVTLQPEEIATVLWSLDTACLPGLSDGSSMSIDTLRFRVSWLGLGTSTGASAGTADHLRWRQFVATGSRVPTAPATEPQRCSTQTTPLSCHKAGHDTLRKSRVL